MKITKVKKVDLIFIPLLTVIYIIAFTTKEGTWFYNLVYDIDNWFRNLSGESKWILPITLVVCIIGDLLIVHPHLPFVYLVSQWYPHWWLLAIIAALGQSIGNMIAYGIGGGISKLDPQTREDMTQIGEYLEHKGPLAPAIIFLLAVSPWGDELATYPTGMIKYNPFTVWLMMFLGKLVSFFLLTYLGFLTQTNINAVDDLIANHPSLLFLRLFIPSAEIEPRNSLLEFSLIFVIAYIMMKVNIDRFTDNLVFINACTCKKYQEVIKKCPSIKNNKDFQKCVSDIGKQSGFTANRKVKKCYKKYKPNQCN